MLSANKNTRSVTVLLHRVGFLVQSVHVNDSVSNIDSAIKRERRRFYLSNCLSLRTGFVLQLLLLICGIDFPIISLSSQTLSHLGQWKGVWQFHIACPKPQRLFLTVFILFYNVTFSFLIFLIFKYVFLVWCLCTPAQQSSSRGWDSIHR